MLAEGGPMGSRRLSIKALTIGNLVVLGLAAIILSIIAGVMYKSAAQNEESRVLSRIVEVASSEVLKNLQIQVKDLGETTEKTGELRGLVKDIATGENKQAVVSLLNDQFHQRFVTSGVLSLSKIRLYDVDLTLLAESSEGITGLPPKLTEALYAAAKEREGGDRLKALPHVWTSNVGAHLSMLLPVGGMRLMGYLEMIVDPAFNLHAVENILKAPVRLSVNKTEIFKSEKWPTETDGDTLVVQYTLPTADNQPAVNVEVVENIKEFNASFSKTQLMALAGFVIIIALCVGSALFMFNRCVFGPLRGLMDNMNRCAHGDLTITIGTRGLAELQSLASSLRKLIDGMRGQVGEIGLNAGQLSSAAEQLSVVTSESSEGLKQQQHETDQVATAITEMSSTVQEVARSAEAAAAAARNADQETNNGRQVVTKAIEQIGALAHEIERATDVIHKLEGESGKIGSVMDVIHGIAEQTNLLALNAAIEAARAGEQGRGFAVVADEVRVLASRTQQSTQEIQAMIERLQNGAKEAVKAMQDSKAKAQATVSQAAKAGTSLDGIAQAVSSISEMNTHIASAAEEQSAVSEEINRSIVRISEIAEKSANGAQQTASASETLAHLAVKLQNVVNQFKL